MNSISERTLPLNEGDDFAFISASSPRTAFRILFEYIQQRIENDEDFRAQFERFQKEFRGPALAGEQSSRFEECLKQGAGRLGIKVGGLPLFMGPGLALLYDATLARLRTIDTEFRPELIDARVIRIVADHVDRLLPILGSASLSALEVSLRDQSYRDRLGRRASDLGVAYLDDLPPAAGCEFCEISTLDDRGNVINRRCGSKVECEAVGIILIIVAIIAVIKWLGDLFDWW